jgi:hypothetical protein
MGYIQIYHKIEAKRTQAQSEIKQETRTVWARLNIGGI